MYITTLGSCPALFLELILDLTKIQLILDSTRYKMLDDSIYFLLSLF